MDCTIDELLYLEVNRCVLGAIVYIVTMFVVVGLIRWKRMSRPEIRGRFIQLHTAT